MSVLVNRAQQARVTTSASSSEQPAGPSPSPSPSPPPPPAPPAPIAAGLSQAPRIATPASAWPEPIRVTGLNQPGIRLPGGAVPVPAAPVAAVAAPHGARYPGAMFRHLHRRREAGTFYGGIYPARTAWGPPPVPPTNALAPAMGPTMAPAQSPPPPPPQSQLMPGVTLPSIAPGTATANTPTGPFSGTGGAPSLRRPPSSVPARPQPLGGPDLDAGLASTIKELAVTTMREWPSLHARLRHLFWELFATMQLALSIAAAAGEWGDVAAPVGLLGSGAEAPGAAAAAGAGMPAGGLEALGDDVLGEILEHLTIAEKVRCGGR